MAMLVATVFLGDHPGLFQRYRHQTMTLDRAYLDTPERDSYLGAARKRPDRFKVRIRTYLDDGTGWVEVKLRDRRGRTVKHRLVVDRGQDGARRDDGRLGEDGLAFVAGLVPGIADRLRPTLTTSYCRSTLLSGDSRVTIDRGVRCTTPDGRTAAISGVVVETKSARAGGSGDRALWSLGARPVKISKFGSTLAALHPELPANKWHRVIGRHVVVAPVVERPFRPS